MEAEGNGEALIKESIWNGAEHQAEAVAHTGLRRTVPPPTNYESTKLTPDSHTPQSEYQSSTHPRYSQTTAP